VNSAKDNTGSKDRDRLTTRGNPVEVARDDVLRKIGRNVVNFQKMEAMLKALNAQQSITGSLGELQVLLASARKAVAKKTMGPLAEAFVNSVFSAAPKVREPVDSREVAVSFSFRIEADQLIAEERKKALRAVVAERNKLVHRWLAGFDPHSKESCVQLSAKLDAQHASVMPEFEALRGIVAVFKELRAEMVRCVASDEFLTAISVGRASESDVNR